MHDKLSRKNQIKKRSMGTICNRVLAQNGRLQIDHIVS